MYKTLLSCMIRICVLTFFLNLQLLSQSESANTASKPTTAIEEYDLPNDPELLKDEVKKLNLEIEKDTRNLEEITDQRNSHKRLYECVNKINENKISDSITSFNFGQNNARSKIKVMYRSSGINCGDKIDESFGPTEKGEIFSLKTDIFTQVFEKTQEFFPISEIGAPYYVSSAGVDKEKPFDSNDIEQIKSEFLKEKILQYKEKIVEIAKIWETKLGEFETKQKTSLEASQTKLKKVNLALDKGKRDINQDAIRLGLPLFCLTVLLLYFIPFFANRFLKGTTDFSILDIFKSGLLSEIITVLLLTMTILILGLANVMQGEILGTLLGGISAYVLNRIQATKTSQS
jgi:hypothetical protein